MAKLFKWMLILILMLCASFVLINAVSTVAQPPVTAEAVGQANLRANTSTESSLMGQIVAGTQYPVIGRSEFFPWYLLGDPATNQPLGWVFADLVTVQGDVFSVALSTLDMSGATPVPTSAVSTPAAGASQTATPSVEAISTPIPTSSVTGTVLGEINIRYGPGVEYPRIGVARAGEVLSISAWHTQLPWVQIDYPASPNGEAWVAVDLLEINGDLYSMPAFTQTLFNLPTLTPTPPSIQQGILPGLTPVPLSPEFSALANQLWDMMLAADFDPATSHFGSLFLMNLESGEAIAFGDEVAFSGMSVNKIAILSTYYSLLDTPPGDQQAYTIAEAMVCSENISTNELLTEVGAGNPYTGAERVTEFLQQFGAAHSFIYTPYDNDPFITPQAPHPPLTTGADQVSAEPDPYNQMTVSEVGALLNGVYQCGYGEGGALLERFPDDFTPTECRQMLEVMSHNRIGSLIEMGVPEDVRVSHKHGWINDTHGDAAVVFSPGGAYILVVVLHNPVWLEFSESEPLIEEMSRTVYNAFNPDAPLAEVRPFDPAADADVATCNANLFGSQLIDDLRSSEFDR